MTDYADPTGGSGNSDVGGSVQDWLTGAQQRLARGLPLDGSGIWDPAHGRYGVPGGWRVEGNQLVQDGNLWGATWPGLVGMAAMGGLGALVGPTAASVSGLGPTTADSMAATQAAMNGATVPASLAAPDAAAALTALGPSTTENMTATQAAMNGANVPPSLAAATTPLLGGTAGNITKALVALTSALGGKAIANASGANSVPPQLTDLLNQSVKRQKELAPLGTAATAGMYQMLPDFAKTAPAAQGAQSLLGVKANG